MLLPTIAATLVLGCGAAGRAPLPEPLPDPPEHREDTVIALAAAPQPVSRERLVARIDSILALPEFRSARWGVLVVHPERGDTLYARDADKLFMPASNQKLVVGAAALRLLGPDFRFTTTFAASGPVRGGVLEGDLVVHGRGDPTFSTRVRGDALAPFRDLADSLSARGIRRITGRVVVGDSVFAWPTMGYGVAWENLRTRFGAPVSDLMFDESSSTVTITAGARAGAAVTALVLPAVGYPRVRVTAATLPASSAGTMATDTLAIEYRADEIVVSGGLPVRETRTLTLVHQDPRAAFLAALRTALAARAINVGDVRQSPRPARDTLFVYQSAPLSEISALLQKPSQNQTAEVLKRTLALELTGVGAPDSGRRVLEADLLAMGAEEDGFVIGDAAGMSRYNFLTPETIVRLLNVMRDDSVFVTSLPLIGVEGTLQNRLRSSAAAGRGRAKTGSISNGAALSGYLRTADDEQLLFSILANNWIVESRDVLVAIDAVVNVLAGIRYRELAASSPH